MSSSKIVVWLKIGSLMLVAKLTSALKQSGFRQSYSNYSLYTYSTSIIFFCVLVYVDDLISTGTNAKAIQKFKDISILVST